MTEMHQMTIFEWLQPVQEYPDINDITEAEAAQIVGKALGLCSLYITNCTSDGWRKRES